MAKRPGKTKRAVKAKKTQNTYRISGQAVNVKTRSGISGLRVEAWDEDLICDDLVGSATTDARGHFVIEFDVSYFRELFLDRRPDLYFRVFQEDRLVASTENSVLWNVEAPDTTVEIPVDPSALKPGEPPQTPEASFVVRGRVFQEYGAPLAGATVRAFHLGLAGEEKLGETTTGANGRYAITYRPMARLGTQNRGANLLVRIFDKDGTPVVTSNPQFHAPQEATVDLVAVGKDYRGPSEYERIAAAITPLLGNPPPTEFSEKNVRYLAGETGLPAHQLTIFSRAAKLATETGLPSEVCYGLLRAGLPDTLEAFLSQSSKELRSALDKAFRGNLVPAALETGTDGFITAFQKRSALHLVSSGRDGTRPILSKMVGPVLPDTNRQAELAEKLLAHRGTAEEFWKALGDDPAWRESVADLQFSFQVGAIALGHQPLIQAIWRRQEHSLRDLAQLDEKDWEDLLKSRSDDGPISAPPEIPGASEEERIRNYAAKLAEIVEDAAPTSVFARKLRQKRGAGLEQVGPFLEGNPPDFDLRNTPIEGLFTEPLLEDQRQLKEQLKRSQRIARLTNFHDDTLELLSERNGVPATPSEGIAAGETTRPPKPGLGSALEIVEMGRNAFVEAYQRLMKRPEDAEAIFARAEQISATTLALFARYSPAINSVEPKVLAKDSAPLSSDSNLTKLFGSLSLCECRHCSSVYGPAAYLVDLLAFLKPHSQTRPVRPAISDPRVMNLLVPTVQIPLLQVLRERRADIFKLELTCENTNTPIPYVDLVLEILEDAVSPPSDPVLAAKMRQTTGSAEELAANPQFVNTGAYNNLRNGVYPFNLPFDLWVEEARIYLNHLGVPRHELMRIFQTIGAPIDPGSRSDLAIATEYLGLTTVERQIITGLAIMPISGSSAPLFRVLKPWDFWGLEENDNLVPEPLPDHPDNAVHEGWIAALSRVQFFFDRAGLSFADLQELLRLNFIDPVGNVDIRVKTGGDASTCDPTQLRILRVKGELTQPLADADWGRIYRFLRLWRKLGWTMRELDNAITALKPGDLTEGFLQELADIQRLRNDLNVPLEAILSWYAPIDTARTANRDEPVAKSLYERLFQNPAVVRLNPDETDPYELNASRGELKTVRAHELSIDSTDTDADKKRKQAILGVLRGALGIGDADLELCINSDQAVVTAGKELNLENLSRLYRMVSFALSLRLSFKDFWQFKELCGLTPFVDGGGAVTPSNTHATVQFVESIGKLRASGFSVAELNYLLTPRTVSPSEVAPDKSSIAQVLDEIRAGLQKISVENAAVPDPTGAILGQKLELLQWSSATIAEVIAAVSDSRIYEVPLNALPSGVSLENTVKGKASFDPSSKTLRFKGPMAPAEKDALIRASADPAYQDAVNALSILAFDNLKTFVIARMKAFVTPFVFEAALDALPPGLSFPTEPKAKVHHDPSAKVLRFHGEMTPDEQITLLRLSPDSSYMAAVNSLFDAPALFVPTPDNSFMTATDADNLFDQPKSAEERMGLIQEKLQRYLRRTQSETFIKQKLSEALKLEAATTGELLTLWVNSPHQPAQKSIFEFLAPAFAESDPLIKVTETAFTGAFDTYRLLHKIALVIGRLKIPREQLLWVFRDDATNMGYADPSAWLNLATLPVSGISAASYLQWERLVDLFQLRDALPQGGTAMTVMFTRARDSVSAEETLLRDLSHETRWPFEDLKFLASPRGLALTFPEAYRDENALMRLRNCFAAMKRLGLSAECCRDLAQPDLSSAEARTIKQAAKAKYDNQEWSAVAKPLRDPLRERQRTALVSYLTFWKVDPPLRDSDALFRHYLIDVEMSPCQMTSRIKQAIGSVQLFIQRCLMGLEPGISLGEEAAERWKWMRNYRVWEANRKVFLYPENWIEPELRDDKTPFFKDLENELLQKDVTDEAAEDAILHYLEKLDTVARLEIVGLYHERRSEGADADVLHVFGRTPANPHVYYYRRRVEPEVWTPWERVDVDIEGEHLIPVVYEGRLHLFWPIFSEKADKEQPQPAGNSGESQSMPNTHWEIQLAWSELRNGRWSAKKVTTESLIWPGLIPRSSSFRMFVPANAPTRAMEIALGPQPTVGEETPITDHPVDPFGDDPQKQPAIEVIPASRSVEEGRTASFTVRVTTRVRRGMANVSLVFPELITGGLKELVQWGTGDTGLSTSYQVSSTRKDLALTLPAGLRVENYHFDVNVMQVVTFGGGPTVSFGSSQVVATASLEITEGLRVTPPSTFPEVGTKDFFFRATKEERTGNLEIECLYQRDATSPSQRGAFVFTGCPGRVTIQEFYGPPRFWPDRTKPENQMFVETPGDTETPDDTTTPKGALELPPAGATPDSRPMYEPVLGQTPGIFRLLVPHQDEQFLAENEKPFFYQDDTRTFTVTPHSVVTANWRPEASNPALLERVRESYLGPRLNDGGSVLPGALAVRIPSGRTVSFREKRYQFQIFYHPFVCEFIRALNQGGATGTRSIGRASTGF